MDSLVIPLEELLPTDDFDENSVAAALVQEMHNLLLEHSLQSILSSLSVACALAARSIQIETLVEGSSFPSASSKLWAKTSDLLAILANTPDWHKLHEQFALDLHGLNMD